MILDVILNNVHSLSLKEQVMINAFSFSLFLKSKKKRTYDIINSDYDDNLWDKDVQHIDLATHDISLSDSKKVIVHYKDKLVKCRFSNFEKTYKQMLVKLLSEYIDDSIVEMGCGMGSNLLLLHNAGFKNLKGYDLSKNAITRAKQYSKKNQLPLDFEVSDLNQSFAKNMIDGKVVFTHHCLEQCTLFMPNVLKNLVSGKPKIVINFEVDYDSASPKVKRYMNYQGYQNNLVSELKKLEKQNEIEIISITKLPLAFNSFNVASMIIWKTK